MATGIVVFGILLIAGTWVLYNIWYKGSERAIQKELADIEFTEGWERILQDKVKYYAQLDEADKSRFRELMLRFIHTTHISGGGGVKMTEELLVLTAASAVIPILNLPGWPYHALNEVILTPDNVRNPGDIYSAERSDILGMVYSGSPTQHTVFLSAPSLLAGFANAKDSRNVGIHEFAHLIDGDDGSIDGIPTIFMTKELIPKWKALIEKGMNAIEQGDSSINPYGATNEQEFFAVISEAYFENPDRVKKEHPEVFEVLSQIYNNDVA